VQRRELADQVENAGVAAEAVEQILRAVTVSARVGRFLAGMLRR
jgi:hypothetical protein